jgi:hypothetical protein
MFSSICYISFIYLLLHSFILFQETSCTSCIEMFYVFPFSVFKLIIILLDFYIRQTNISEQKLFIAYERESIPKKLLGENGNEAEPQVILADPGQGAEQGLVGARKEVEKDQDPCWERKEEEQHFDLDAAYLSVVDSSAQRVYKPPPAPLYLAISPR